MDRESWFFVLPPYISSTSKSCNKKLYPFFPVITRHVIIPCHKGQCRVNTCSNEVPMDDPSYRLLYRGALSLPDSLLLLDGLTFAVRLNSPSKHSAFDLLQNPLALALESMRGRPSLRFLGTVFLRDVWMDESGAVEMYVISVAFQRWHL